jgi:SNF2 family DNA or RNA helicase
MHAAVQAVIPGLALRLYPHQVRGVLWMLEHERHQPKGEPRPYFQAVRTEVGRVCFINEVTGAIPDKPPPALRDCRGGLLCDEPGLGKTITVLALVLRTHGMLPAPRYAHVSECAFRA